MTERIAKMTVDLKIHDLLPESVRVEFDPLDYALPEGVMNAKRITEYILAQPVYITDTNRFTGMFRLGKAAEDGVPCDIFTRMGHPWFRKAMDAFYCKYAENTAVFEWQHSAPNYRKILTDGIEGRLRDIARAKEMWKYDREKSEFLDGMEIICNGVIAWEEKCAAAIRDAAGNEKNAARRAELSKMADTLDRVPRYPAGSFYEALTSLLFCFFYLPDSVGTIDRTLLPYYQKDIESGAVTMEEAKELLQEVFVHLCNYTPAGNGNADRSAECHFAIGGYTERGEDGFSDLSRLMVEALMETDMRRPSISLRWNEKTPFEVLRFMLDCERKDKNKRFAFVNDEPRIRALMKICKLPFSEAVRYTMVGCNEPSFPGTVWYGGCTVNVARAMTDTLYKHRGELLACKTYEEFYAVFRAELSHFIDDILRYANAFGAIRAKDQNLLSCFLLDGCIESGVSATQFGCSTRIGGNNLMGFTSVIDSLSVIRQYVYEDKTVTMEHLLDVLESDWEKDPDLRTHIYKNAKFFGNDDPLSNEEARRFTSTLYELTGNRRYANGATILFGTLTGYHAHYAEFGRRTAATPDGRRAGESFMVGTGQAQGKDRKGMIPLLNSVAQMDPTGIMNGPVVVNLLIEDKIMTDDAYFEKFCHVVETYFRKGGPHIQLNYVSGEDLLAARKMPENYQNLRVRVSGFSAAYVGLKTDIQDEILRRTEQKG